MSTAIDQYLLWKERLTDINKKHIKDVVDILEVNYEKIEEERINFLELKNLLSQCKFSLDDINLTLNYIIDNDGLDIMNDDNYSQWEVKVLFYKKLAEIIFNK